MMIILSVVVAGLMDGAPSKDMMASVDPWVRGNGFGRMSTESCAGPQATSASNRIALVK